MNLIEVTFLIPMPTLPPTGVVMFGVSRTGSLVGPVKSLTVKLPGMVATWVFGRCRKRSANSDGS